CAMRWCCTCPGSTRGAPCRTSRNWTGCAESWRKHLDDQFREDFMNCIRKTLIAACGFVLAAPLAGFAAPGYPERPIRFIVPFPPGGGNDIVGRIVAQKLAEGLRQTVVVDNRGGAGGTIGTDMTAKAPADGHTMLVNNISLAVNATLIPKLPYDTLRHLAAVS